MPQNSSSPALAHTVARILFLAVCTALALGMYFSTAPAQAATCTTDRDCANWAVQHGQNPDTDPYTKGKATLAAPAPQGTGHSVGQEVPSCDHIDWTDVQPVDLNKDGYIDCGSDIELGA